MRTDNNKSLTRLKKFKRKFMKVSIKKPSH